MSCLGTDMDCPGQRIDFQRTLGLLSGLISLNFVSVYNANDDHSYFMRKLAGRLRAPASWWVSSFRGPVGMPGCLSHCSDGAMKVAEKAAPQTDPDR